MKTVQAVLVVCPLGPEGPQTLIWTQFGIKLGRLVQKMLEDFRDGGKIKLFIATPQWRVATLDPDGFDEIITVPADHTCSVVDRARFILDSDIPWQHILVVNVSGLTVCRQSRFKKPETRMISLCRSKEDLRGWAEAPGFRPLLVGTRSFRWQGWRHFVARKIWWFGSISHRDLEIGAPLSPKTRHVMEKAVTRCFGMR